MVRISLKTSLHARMQDLAEAHGYDKPQKFVEAIAQGDLLVSACALEPESIVDDADAGFFIGLRVRAQDGVGVLAVITDVLCGEFVANVREVDVVADEKIADMRLILSLPQKGSRGAKIAERLLSMTYKDMEKLGIHYPDEEKNTPLIEKIVFEFALVVTVYDRVKMLAEIAQVIARQDISFSACSAKEDFKRKGRFQVYLLLSSKSYIKINDVITAMMGIKDVEDVQRASFEDILYLQKRRL